MSMLEVLDIIAVIVAGMAGAMVAGREKMDLFGVYVIAFCTALGGGTLRDLVLGSYPLIWIENTEYLMWVLVAVALAMLLRTLLPRMKEAFLALDALSIVTFAILGAQKALSLGHDHVTAAIMAVFTGVFGGVIRDVLCHSMPLIFRRELYAGVALVTAVIYMGMLDFGFAVHIATLTALTAGFALRITAIVFRIELPRFSYLD
ncbi:trimeric intracellular cation channel family protein [Endozoicomonadaceae bacterium StTr2]